MLTLYVIRHAKSSWSDPLQADFHRELNSRGLRDAPAMGKHFVARGERVDLFVSSPAIRAFSTAQAVALAFGVQPQKIVAEPKLYLASAATWMEVVNALPTSVRSAALFAHNPGISEFCELLTEGGLGELPTCAMVRVDLGTGSWAAVSRGAGTVAWYDFPKQHTELQ